MDGSILNFLLEAEFGHNLRMRLWVGLLEIGNELLSFGNHLQESATGMEVLLIFLEMESQALDLLGKEGYLILRRTGILLMPLDFLGNSILLLVRQRHSVIQPYPRTSSEDAAPKYATKKIITHSQYHALFFLTRWAKNVSMICPNPRTVRGVHLERRSFYGGAFSSNTARDSHPLQQPTALAGNYRR